ncbi:hypothetical protein D3C78_1386360 [compost metagenome]
MRERSSFIALMRSASASDSSPTSSAEPIWLAYMVRNTLGRKPSTISVLITPPSRKAVQAKMK